MNIFDNERAPSIHFSCYYKPGWVFISQIREAFSITNRGGINRNHGRLFSQILEQGLFIMNHRSLALQVWADLLLQVYFATKN